MDKGKKFQAYAGVVLAVSVAGCGKRPTTDIKIPERQPSQAIQLHKNKDGSYIVVPMNQESEVMLICKKGLPPTIIMYDPKLERGIATKADPKFDQFCP